MNARALPTVAIGLSALLPASASAQINVSATISTSTTWTSANVYRLTAPIYVANGATLTIEPGTVIVSAPFGRLHVARGSKIYAEGVAGAPILFTSEADASTWVGGDPETSTWRASAFEWGGLQIFGEAFVASDSTPAGVAFGGSPSPNPGNQVLGSPPAAPTGVPSTANLYGGGDDDDDSGSLRYVSLRYCGRDIDPSNELDALFLGAVGRGTTIDHVEIMNSIDDGISIDGGSCNLKYTSVWNVGDDSWNIRRGWRGKAQFGLIVQGYCLNEAQGSGLGDNAIELRGSFGTDWQPFTTAAFENFTVIGNPADGDGLTSFGQNARAQFRRCIFMDGGESVVRADGGYGANGTLPFAALWQTPFDVRSTINAAPNPAALYQAQTSGTLCEMSDSVFFRNLSPFAYVEAVARGVFTTPNSNVLIAGSLLNNVGAPIQNIVRGAPFQNVVDGRVAVPCVFLDPRPANAALVSVGYAPSDGFFSPALYRGAFSPFTRNTWLAGWTASETYGFTSSDAIGVNRCGSAANSTGVAATIRAAGSDLVSANTIELEARDVPPNVFGIFIVSPSAGSLPNPLGPGTICLDPLATLRLNAPGEIRFSGPSGVLRARFDIARVHPSGSLIPADALHFQAWFRDASPAAGQVSNLSDATVVTFR